MVVILYCYINSGDAFLLLSPDDRSRVSLAPSGVDNVNNAVTTVVVTIGQQQLGNPTFNA